MQPVTIYRWDDLGAPQISTAFGTANEFKAVLDAVLVTGYGDKPALGWKKKYDDVNGVVYSNDDTVGSGGMIRFWPQSGDWDAAFNWSLMMKFEASNQFLTSSDANKKGSFYCFRHPVTSTSINEIKSWVVIGTKTAFYMILGSYSATSTTAEYTMQSSLNYNYSMFAGDYDSVGIDNDPHRFIAFAGAEYGGQDSLSFQNTLDAGFLTYDKVTTPKHIKIWDADNSNNHHFYAVRLQFEQGLSAGTAMPNVGNDLIAYSNCLLSLDSYSNSADYTDAAAPFIRGSMPGMINTLVGEGLRERWPYTRLINGVEHWLLRHSNQGRSHVWINMEQW